MKNTITQSKKMLGAIFFGFDLEKSMSVLGLFILLVFGSACKKESSDGIAGGPAVTDFPGCQLKSFNGGIINYNVDGTIQNFGGLDYVYVGNKVRLQEDGFDLFVFVLDNRKYPVSGTFYDDTDSSLITYSYDASGYLKEIGVIEYIDGDPGTPMAISFEYENGNRVKSVLKSEGIVISTVEYSYAGGKVDSRQDFYSRVFLNFADQSDIFPLYGGKSNKLLPTKATITEDGDLSVANISYEFDSMGKVIKQTYDTGIGSPDLNTFYYDCK